MLIENLTQHAMKHQQHRPFVVLSFAQSLDGSLAFGEGQRTHLSGKASLTWVHHLRNWADGILIGRQTAAIDNPQLTVRLIEGKNPQRIVLDSYLRLPPEMGIFHDDQPRPIMIHCQDAARESIVKSQQLGCHTLACESDTLGLIPTSILRNLHQQGIKRLLIEGGAKVISSFLAAGVVDYVAITLCPTIALQQQTIRYATQQKPCQVTIKNPQYLACDPDIILHGSID